MDVEAIRLGYDFRLEIDQTIKVCSMVIVVIAPRGGTANDGLMMRTTVCASKSSQR